MRVLRNRSVCSYGKCGNHAKKISEVQERQPRRDDPQDHHRNDRAERDRDQRRHHPHTRTAQRCAASKLLSPPSLAVALPSEPALEGTREVHSRRAVPRAPRRRCWHEPLDRQRRQRTLRREVRVAIGVGVGVMPQVARPMAREAQENQLRRHVAADRVPARILRIAVAHGSCAPQSCTTV